MDIKINQTIIILQHSMHFINILRTINKIMSKNGKNALTNTLNKNLLDPKIFRFDQSKKQSKETIISDYCPTSFKGLKVSLMNFG